jgi:hypothetical protein
MVVTPNDPAGAIRESDTPTARLGVTCVATTFVSSQTMEVRL